MTVKSSWNWRTKNSVKFSIPRDQILTSWLYWCHENNFNLIGSSNQSRESSSKPAQGFLQISFQVLPHPSFVVVTSPHVSRSKVQKLGGRNRKDRLHSKILLVCYCRFFSFFSFIFVWSSVSQSVIMLTCPPVYLSVWSIVCQCIPVHLTVCLSVCLTACLTACPPFSAYRCRIVNICVSCVCVSV